MGAHAYRYLEESPTGLLTFGGPPALRRVRLPAATSGKGQVQPSTSPGPRRGDGSAHLPPPPATPPPEKVVPFHEGQRPLA